MKIYDLLPFLNISFSHIFFNRYFRCFTSHRKHVELKLKEMAKTGRPRGRPRKIRPEDTSPPVPKVAKVVKSHEKKKCGRKKKTDEQKFIEKQQREFEKLNPLPHVVDISGRNASFPDITLKPKEGVQLKKLGKIPIIKFKRPVRSKPLPKLIFDDIAVSPFQPLTPPPSDVSRSNSELSAKSSLSPITPKTSIHIYEPLAKFQLINAWLARKHSNWCIKNSSVFKNMRTKKGLISTYKCMAKTCSYTTTSPKNFGKHIRCHEDTSNDIAFLYYCPYCFFTGSSGEKLLDHYIECHNHDRFQCGYCFYRSADSHSCWEHCITFHADLPRIVYECPLELVPNTETTKLRLKENRQRFVLPLHCSICSLQFFLIDPYENHIKQHISVPDINSTAINDFKMYEKKLVNNQIGRYECLFCEYGTNQRGKKIHFLYARLPT